MQQARKQKAETKYRGVYEKVSGSGEWWILWYDHDGKRHREKVGAKGAAIKLYQKRKSESLGQHKVPALRNTKRVTVSDLVDIAIEYTANHKDSRNYVSKGAIVREQFGDRAAADVTPQQFEQWLSGHCKTPATTNRYRAFLSLCYRVGIANGKVTVNPARSVRQKKESNARLRYLTREEYDRLYAVIQKRCPEHLAEFIASVNTGMRRSEQYSCTWSQVDLKRRAIDLTETKNGSARTIHLNPDALAAIESMKVPGRKPSDRVFPSGPRDYSTKNWFVPCLEEAKITGYVWHGNRHTFCSWLAMAGATIKEIQELAGHKTIIMSARYAHLSPDHKLSVIDRIASTAT